MPVFVCRWPDGDCSLVFARSKEAAIERLDEVGNAEGCPAEPAPEFLITLHLQDDGTVTVDEFGDGMEGIWEFLYPLLSQAFQEHAKPNQVRAAVRAERHRVHARDTPAPETELGRNLKRIAEMPTRTVNRIVREVGAKALDEADVPPRNRRH